MPFDTEMWYTRPGRLSELETSLGEMMKQISIGVIGFGGRGGGLASEMETATARPA